MPKPKTEEEFNISLSKLVEKYPCLYDFTRKDYTSNAIRASAWHDISQSLCEGVEDCKLRWKSLRGCITRDRKVASQGNKNKKPYYLQQHLEFVKPFTRAANRTSRASVRLVHYPQQNEIQDTLSSTDAEEQDSHDSSNLEVKYQHQPQQQQQHPQVQQQQHPQVQQQQHPQVQQQQHPQVQQQQHPQVQQQQQIQQQQQQQQIQQQQQQQQIQQQQQQQQHQTVVHLVSGSRQEEAQCIQVQQLQREVEHQTILRTETPIKRINELPREDYITISSSEDNHPEMAFFRSLIPDINRMNPRQRSSFRLGVSSLIDQVLYGSTVAQYPEPQPQPEPTPPCSTVVNWSH